VFSEEDTLFAAQAVAEGGIPVIEITLTVPNATQVISHLVKNHLRTVVGAGGVKKVPTARECLDAGAQFLTGDGLHPAVTERRQQEQIGELARRFLGFVKLGRDRLAARAARRTALGEE
jgi:2-dehydro-3-deoxyphosphogluconate aldolase/(4S)-4-hydroxy-2-oxoglutarate aldolase